MKKFIVIYHAPADAWKQNENATAEDMKKGMEMWMKWAEKCGESLTDMGTPLAGGLRLQAGGGAAPSTKEVAGYSILSAENMDAAKALLEGHPHLMWGAGCDIEVHEAQPMPGA